MAQRELTPGLVPAAVDWVFAYGSLMWNPGFSFVTRTTAKLDGYHRAFCLYSHHYRGTPEKPGLVLGLAESGYCTGVAFRMIAEERDNAIAYLNERELMGYAYQPAVVSIEIEGAEVPAYTFVADPSHRLYAGDLGADKAAELIMSAKGHSGLNRDYLINTIKQLENMGFRDAPLHDLLARVQYLTGLIDQGSGI